MKKRTSLILFGCHLVRLAGGFISNIVLARSLGDTGFGVFSATISILGLTTGLATLGLPAGQTLMSARHPRWNGALTFVSGSLLTACGVLGGAALCILSAWAHHTRAYEATAAAILCYVVPSLFQAGNLYYANLVAQGDSGKAVMIGTSLSFIGIVVRVTAALCGASVGLLVALTSLETLAGALLGGWQLWRQGWHKPTLRRGVILTRLLLKWSVKNLLLAQTETLFFKIEIIVLNTVGFAAAAGEFSVAQRFFEMALLLVSYLMIPVPPALARLSRESAQRRHDYMARVLGMLGLAGAALSLANLILSPLAIHLLYGRDFSRSAPVAMFLSLAMLPTVLFAFNWRAGLVLGGAKRNMKLLFATALLKGAAVWFFAQRGDLWLATGTFCAGSWIAWAITAFCNHDCSVLAGLQGTGLWHWMTCREDRQRLVRWSRASLRSGDLFDPAPFENAEPHA